MVSWVRWVPPDELDDGLAWQPPQGPTAELRCSRNAELACGKGVCNRKSTPLRDDSGCPFPTRRSLKSAYDRGDSLFQVRFLLAICSAALLAPPIAVWVWLQERQILRSGRPLLGEETGLAEAVGMKDPTALRVLVLETVPMPGPQWTHRFAHWLGFPALTAAGMSLGKGIYLQRKFEDRPILLAHECVHSAQYERHGILGFLWRYLYQCVRVGYVNAPFEREAVDLSEAACRIQASDLTTPPHQPPKFAP